MNTARSFSIVVLVLGLSICTPLFVVAAQSAAPVAPLAGERWYRGDGLGYNITLILGEDGRYDAIWTGCFGEYGRSQGTWVDHGVEIALAPEHEDGMMQGHLRSLRKVTVRGTRVLVPPENLAEARNGVDALNVTAFQREQSIEF